MANIPPRPLGKNFFGVFHAPLPAGDSDACWGASWDFDATFKVQIDAAVAAGANLFAHFGSIKAVPTGVITLATYLARRKQLLDYLDSKRMYSITYAAYTRYAWGTVTHAQACDLFAADAEQCAKYPGTIGYATTDEPWASGNSEGNSYCTDADLVAEAAGQYAAIKAVAPDLPVCCAPNPCGNTALPVFRYESAFQTRCDSIAPYCDFFIFHPFHTISLSDSAAVRAAYPGKTLAMFSSVLSRNGDSDMATKTASIMGLVGSNNFRGMCWFTAVDFDADTWGMFNSDGTARTAKTSAFTTGLGGYNGFPARSLRPYRGRPRLNSLRNWGYK